MATGKPVRWFPGLTPAKPAIPPAAKPLMKPQPLSPAIPAKAPPKPPRPMRPARRGK